MASVKAKIFEEETIPINTIEIKDYNYKIVIYICIAITILLFFRKLVVKFCRQPDRSCEAKYE